MRPSKPAPRFRPTAVRLEDRLTPSLSAGLAAGTLTVTGTPNAAGPAQVRWTGADQYEVADGQTVVGTYAVTGGLTVTLATGSVQVDLGGDTLPGSVLVDLGTGNGGGTVTSSAGAAVVVGGVRFNGGAGLERFALTVADKAAVEVRGSVSADSVPVTTFLEDSFFLGAGVTVRGSLTTRRITYNAVSGEVAGDVTALGLDTPGGVGNSYDGKIGGNLLSTGGATLGYSYQYLFGTVGGSVTLTNEQGYMFVNTGGKVGGSLRYTAGAAASSGAYIGGSVAKSLTVDLGGGTGTTSGTVYLEDLTVGGGTVVRGRNTTTNIVVGETFTDGETGEVFRIPADLRGGLLVQLGNGTNSLTIDPDAGNKIGGVLMYVGGTGADTVKVGGTSTARLFVLTGGGNDTVAFAPGAKVSSAVIDFGAAPGKKAYVPPTVSFPLVVTRLTAP